MSESDPVLADYDALGSARIGFLETLELSQDVNPQRWSGLTLTLKLQSSGEPDAPCMHLEFYQVQGLRLGTMDGLFCYFVEIQSISERQLEFLHYHVAESEHGAFSFNCHSFVAVSASK